MASIITARASDYKDLDLRMKLHPLYGDIRPVADVEAIKNSIKNILLTKRGERPFNPAFGCSLTSYLFEPADIITKNSMKAEIEFTLQTQEERIKLIDIKIDDYPDRNAYAVTIEAVILNSNKTVDLTIILERLR